MPDPSEIIALLRENETFADAPVDTLTAIAGEMVDRTVTTGRELIRQGEKCGSVFVVTSGEFGVFIDAEPDPVARLGRGRIFGEIGAVSGIDATATVRCLTPGNLLEIPGPALHQAMRQSPDFAASILRSLSRYLGRR